MKYLGLVLTGILLSTSAVAFNFRFAMFSQFNTTANVSPTIANGYKVYSFTSNGNFTVTNGQRMVEYLIIGGGGGAPASGGGGVKSGSILLEKGVYNVVVGSGGLGKQNGNDSAVFNTIAHGGGYGATDTYPGNTGGSGGGVMVVLDLMV